MGARASIFADVEDVEELPGEGELDLAGFKPTPKAARPKPEKAVIREVAARTGFTSREPAAVPAQPDPASARRLGGRRYVTGRTHQLNLKVRPADAERLAAIADAQGWVLGEALQHALDSLEEKLKG